MAIMACSNENYGIKYKQNLKIYLGPFSRDGSAVEEFVPACRQAGRDDFLNSPTPDLPANRV
jgi:hypothetical protein